MAEFPIADLPISPNPGQQNMDKLGSTINDLVRKKMGTLKDSGPEGRHFLRNTSCFGYDGIVVTGGKITSLVNLGRDPRRNPGRNLGRNEEIPPLSLGSEVTIEGNSRGYVSSGHKPGDRVTVIGFIEPFFEAAPGIQSSDKIIQVEGNGIIGWIKPSEFDKHLLKEQQETEVRKLFSKTAK